MIVPSGLVHFSADPSRSGTHTLVAADHLGRQVGAKTVQVTSEGHLAALEWARRWAERVRAADY